MKKNVLILSAIFFAGLLASCSDETTDSRGGAPTEKLAKMEIKLLSSSSSSSSKIAARSHGVLPSGTGTITDSEGKINRITVGVFVKATGLTDVITETTTLATGNLVPVNATVGQCEVFVVANAPAGLFTGVANKTEFLDKVVNLDVTKATTTGQLSDNLPMTGQGLQVASTTITLTKGVTTGVDVTLQRLVSRVSIANVKYEFTNLPNAKFTPTAIFLYDAKNTSTCAIGAPATTGTSQGEIGTTVNLLSYLGESVTDFTNGSAFTNPYYFYTFANAVGATTPTRLTIKGFYDVDGDGAVDVADGDATVYYPIIINKAQSGTILKEDGTDVSTDYTTYTGFVDRNKTYALTAVIKKKGVLTPPEVMDPSTISLVVEVAPWAMNITQDVIFE